MLKAAIIEVWHEAAKRRRLRDAACVAMLLLGASCVPLKAADAPTPRAAAVAQPAPEVVQDARAVPLPPEAEEVALTPVAASEAAAINASIPLSLGPNPRAASIVFRAGSAADQQRALQCLSEAVYYEARSESEDGQRAVAQVVLNRVRHPAYPNSVCGVVYQGPMRAGGGCQFTFTCDGSLGAAPGGFSWAQARRIAAAALAGSVYAPVGHATHYHTHEVVPAWAWKLAKVGVVGSHNFYRMHGTWGSPGAFAPRYAGREPAPSSVIATRLPVTVPKVTAAVFTMPTLPTSAVPRAAAIAEPVPQLVIDDRLPDSQVREEYRNSGRWRDEAPGS